MQRNKGKVQNKNNELPTLGIVALGQHFLTHFLCKTYYKTTKWNIFTFLWLQVYFQFFNKNPNYKHFFLKERKKYMFTLYLTTWL